MHPVVVRLRRPVSMPGLPPFVQTHSTSDFRLMKASSWIRRSARDGCSFFRQGINQPQTLNLGTGLGMGGGGF